MKIRDLEKNDKEAMIRLLSQLTSKKLNFDIDNLIEFPNCYCKVLEMDGEVVGTITLVTYVVPSKGVVGRVEEIVVDESQRGKGLGKVLMKYILEFAKEMGLVRVDLTSNPKKVPAARKLYESFGFEIYDTGVFRKEMD